MTLVNIVGQAFTKVMQETIWEPLKQILLFSLHIIPDGSNDDNYDDHHSDDDDDDNYDDDDDYDYHSNDDDGNEDDVDNNDDDSNGDLNHYGNAFFSISISYDPKNDQPSETMSSIDFTVSKPKSGSGDFIAIKYSDTPLKFRRLSLNLTLRIILCKMAAVLEMDVASDATNVITIHTLCELGFKIINPELSSPQTPCESYREIGNIDDSDAWGKYEYMVLEHGRLKIPSEFEDRVNLMSKVFQKMIECLPYTNLILDSLVSAMYGDNLVSELGKLPSKSKIIVNVQYFNVQRCELCIAYGMGKEYEHIRRILRIPFIVQDKTATLLSTFDADSFTGVSMYKLVLCVLCNLCIKCEFDVRIYLNNNSGSLISQITSLKYLGFQREGSNSFVPQMDSESGVGNLGALDEHIAMVFYSEGKRPFTKDDMDQRLFPDSGEGFWTGGGGGGGTTGGKPPLGGDNAALALFGLFVTAVAAGFSSARP